MLEICCANGRLCIATDRNLQQIANLFHPHLNIETALNIQSKFHINQKIKVKNGIKDPDYGFDIGGWTGVIENITLGRVQEDAMCDILWDKPTLKAMGKVLKQKCEDDNLDYERITLGESDLTAT